MSASPTAVASLPAPPASRALRAVFGATFFVRFGFGITVAVFASYIAGRSAGIDTGAVGTVGLVSALAPVGEFSTVLVSGSVADRYGRFPVLLGGMAGAALLLALVGFTRDPVALGAINLLFGVTSGAILASSLAVVGDRAAEADRGLEMGRFDAMNLLGWIAGFAFGFGLLGTVTNADLVLAFWLGSALLAGGVGFALLLVRRVREPALVGRTIDWSTIYRAAFRRDVLLVTLPWLVIYMLLGTLFVFLGSAATGIGIPAWELAGAIGGGGLILLLTQPFYGRLADRQGRNRWLLIGALGFVGVLTAGGLLATFGVRPEYLALVAVSAAAALAYGPAALAALTDLSRTISRATTMAIYTLTISLGMLIGLLVSTRLYTDFGAYGLDVFFAAIAVGLLALTVLRLRSTPTGPVPEATTPTAPG